jgi:cell division protein FtsL
MDTEHTGEPIETGDPIEPAVDVDVEVEDSADAVDLVTETEPESEPEMDADDAEAIDDAAVAEEPATRHRHPAGAPLNIAKRVALDRPTRIGVTSLVFVALMYVFVFPTRSYLAQQRQVSNARHSVQVLRAQNAKLEKEAQRLQTPSEIERLARSQFNMVYEGEEAYNVVPPRGSATTTTVP